MRSPRGLTQRPRTAIAVTLSVTSAGAWVLDAGDESGDRPVVALGNAIDRLYLVDCVGGG